ncbi:MAG: formate/nitrite transporter family protein [Clostridia bacterium]|nr:formate/nitrite transporter family protein [Clostridia bacterium]
MNYLIKSILAGVVIAIGGTIYLSLENSVIGAFLFAIGLYFVVTRQLNLYTGKIGYVVNSEPKYLIELLITLVGNFIGTFIAGFALRYTRIYDKLFSKAEIISNIKLEDSILSIFILSVFCGMLMYLAVDGYKKIQDSFGKNIGVFLCVAVFILCGFEHCIANMYYFTVSSSWGAQALGYMGIMILGNSVGGIFFPLMEKMIKTKVKLLDQEK